MIAFRALFLLLRGRRDVPEGATALPCSGESTSTLVALLVVSVIELVAVEFLVPWAVVRWILLALSVYSVLWLVGYIASLITRPHLVGPEELVLRSGSRVELSFPVTAVRAAWTERKGNHGGSVTVDGETLVLPNGDTTTVVVEFDRSCEVDLGKRGRHAVRRVRFHADDAKTAVRMLRLVNPT
ncbi:hypothetical protein [Allokutzneria oryzae]|uniref:Uncharacterized protein n=1 Tax=Allokutzneria oryzae TaxID=1378989 RepID=A0ABV5ZZW0_9PSEU